MRIPQILHEPRLSWSRLCTAHVSERSRCSLAVALTQTATNGACAAGPAISPCPALTSKVRRCHEASNEPDIGSRLKAALHQRLGRACAQLHGGGGRLHAGAHAYMLRRFEPQSNVVAFIHWAQTKQRAPPGPSIRTSPAAHTVSRSSSTHDDRAPCPAWTTFSQRTSLCQACAHRHMGTRANRAVPHDEAASQCVSGGDSHRNDGHTTAQKSEYSARKGHVPVYQLCLVQVP